MAYFNYNRRKSSVAQIGDTPMGGENPIRIQSMANVSTMDTEAAVAQAIRMIEAGAEYVRFTAQGEREARNLGEIRKQLNEQGYTTPLVADIHFNPRAADAAAGEVEKVRINPGNYVDKVKTFSHLEYTDEEYAAEIEKIRERFVPFLNICKAHGTAIRIGVNHGSLSDRIMSRYGDTPEGMVASCMEFLRICREENFPDVVISIKASNTVVMVRTVRLLVRTMEAENMHYPLHLGVTEAGDGEDGRIKSAVGIGTLLCDGIGDTIRVYKANMIIPQIAENLTRSDNLVIPDQCPVCGGPAVIHHENDAEVLFCENPDCLAKKIKSLTLFVSRDAMNIDGLSEATIEKLLAKGMLHELSDLYHLSDYRDTIIRMEGFGEKSYDKLIAALEASRSTTLPKFIYSLGISNIGLSNAKMICNALDNNLDHIRHCTVEELTEIDGVGEVIARSFVEYFATPLHNKIVDDLLKEITFEQTKAESGAQNLTGLVFVITGSLEHFANRSALKECIENAGGKVTGSVTSKTSYLINNDIASTSSKNKKAKELNVPIITEAQVMEQFGLA